MNSRSIIITVAAILLIAIVGTGLYFLFFAPKSTTGGTQTGQMGTLPNAGDQSNPNNTSQAGGATSAADTTIGTNFGIISNEQVLDYFVDSSNVVTAVEPNGTIIQVTNGQEAAISSITMQNILSVSFSHDGTEVLVSFGDPTDPQTSIFNIATKTWSPLSAGLRSPVWSPSDYRIAYSTSNTNGVETFATIDTSKTKPTPAILTTLHAQNLLIAWPSKNQIVLYTNPTAYAGGSAWNLNVQNAALAPIALEIPGLMIAWSGTSFTPAAPMGLEFSSGSGNLGGSIALIDTSGNVLQQIKFSTLPSKCAFASGTSTIASVVASSTATSSVALNTTTSTPYLYCGVPRDQDGFSVAHLPDDYYQMTLLTSDDIYQINLQTGATAPVFDDQTQNLDISDVKLFNGTLFFINRYDQKLYAISLGA